MKLRWNPATYEDRKEKTKSLDIPSKLDVKNILDKKNSGDTDTRDDKIKIQQELQEISTSRVTPMSKRWKPQDKVVQRSKSAHPIGRINLPDNCWVLERPSSQNMEEEKEKIILELETVKQARLEVADQLEIDRPSSRLQDLARSETLKELEFVKNVRKEGVNEDDFTVEGMGKNNFSEPVEHKSVRFNEEKIDKSFSSPSSSKSFPSTFKSTEESEGAQEPKSKFKQINNISDKRERAR